MTALYGWFVRHARSGQFVRFDPDQQRTASVVLNIREATRFDKQREALDVAAFIATLPMMHGVRLDVVDATIPTPHVPDADKTPVQSREAMLAEAQAAGAARRAAHAAARATHRAKPSGRLLPHPGAPKRRKRKAPAKKAVK